MEHISRRDAFRRLVGFIGGAVGVCVFGRALGAPLAFAQRLEPATESVSADLSDFALGSLGACETGVIRATVSRDPKHQLVISREDLVAGSVKSYNIKGTSGHNHVVILRPEHFEVLKRGQVLGVKSSSTLFHSHICEVKCVTQ